MELPSRLTGKYVELVPLVPDDFERLYAVASDPLVWEQHPNSDRYQRDVFQEFFRGAIESRGAFLVKDVSQGMVIGSSRFHGFDSQKREVEIGWTFLARSHWGGVYNGELKALMLAHAFRFVDTVYFVIGENNLRSQKAVEKIGAKLSRDTRGRDATKVVYEMGRSDWLNKNKLTNLL